MGATMSEENKFLTCSICQGPIEHVGYGVHAWTQGHNAEPVNSGRCCGHCNATVVIPARLRSIQRRVKNIKWDAIKDDKKTNS
jgi:hypothetical protein